MELRKVDSLVVQTADQWAEKKVDSLVDLLAELSVDNLVAVTVAL